MAVLAVFAPVTAVTQGPGKLDAGRQSFVRADNAARRAFEMEPGEVTRPAADERLGEGEKRDEQSRRDGIELRLDPRPQHVGNRDAERSPQHQVGHDPQSRQKYSQPEKENGEREPFDAAEVSGDIRLGRRINRLEKSFAENPVVNNRPVDEPTETRRAVNLAAPFRGASGAEENQMLEAEERLGLAVPFLLFAKCAQGEPPMMPDDGGRAEGDRVSGLLDAPAKIDVVTGLVIFGVEPTDVFEGPPIPGHVTTGNVFGHGVGEQDVARPAGRGGDAGLHPVLRRRRNVRATYPGVIAAEQRAQQIIEPIRIGHAVGIGVGKDFSFRDGGAVVASVTQSVIGLVNVANTREAGADLARVIGRAVIDEDDFIIRIIEPA